MSSCLATARLPRTVHGRAAGQAPRHPLPLGRGKSTSNLIYKA
jgi:hypothetical protein